MTHTSVSSGYRKSSCCTRDSFFSLQVHNIHNVYLNMIWKTSYYLPHRQRYPARTIYNLVAPNNSEPEMILLLYDILQHHTESHLYASVCIWCHYARRNDSTSSLVHDEYLNILFARDGTQVIILLVSIVSCRNDPVWIKYPEPANHLVHTVLSWKYTFYLVWPNYYTHRNDLVRTDDLI